MKNRVETFKDYSVIYLPTGEGVMVDTEDLELLGNYKWKLYSKKGSKISYAVTYISTPNGPRYLHMHTVLLPTENRMVVDHIDQNGLNNRRQNIRRATKAQNAMNSGMYRHNTSGYRGVRWHKRDHIWEAFVRKNNRTIHLGRYATKEDAALAYNEAAKKLHGELVYQNAIGK